MDELAAAAGLDPVAFRLAHMKDPRARAVIEAVAKKAAWKDGEKGDGRRGRGIRFATYKKPARLRGGGGGSRERPGKRSRARAAPLRRGRFRADHQSGRPFEPDRGRHHPVG